MFTRRARQAGVILGSWTLLGLFYGWEIYLFNVHNHHDVPLLRALLRPLPDYWIYAALTPAVLWFSSRFRFTRAKLASTTGLHAGAAVTFLIAWSAAKMAAYPVEDLVTGVAAPRSWYLFRILVVDNVHDALWLFVTLAAMVPNMILQPLVENAVKHGIASRSTPGNIEIRAASRNGILWIEVSDDGPEASGGGKIWTSRGVGISNTRARLQQLYGDAHHFSLLKSEVAGTRVRLEIPFRRQSDRLAVAAQDERRSGLR